MIKILLIIAGLLYALSPYDVIPDFLMGLGWIDDLIVLGLLFRYLYSHQKRRVGAQNRFYQQRFQSQYNRYQRQQGSQGPDSSEAFQDPYQVLGVSAKATPDEIKTAYRQLVNKYHPDKVQHLGDEFQKLAENRFKEIQAAYNKLKAS